MNTIIEQLKKNKTLFYDLLKHENEEIVQWKQSPEKWSLLEIICHLYDEERLDFRFRTQWCLEHPNQIPPAIDPIGWITEHDYLNQDYSSILNKFIKEREQSLKWLHALKNVNWESSYRHSKLGDLTAKHFLENWLAHDYLHMKQIIKLKFDYLKYKTGESLDYAGTWK